jgi:hypothetical protein
MAKLAATRAQVVGDVNERRHDGRDALPGVPLPEQAAFIPGRRPRRPAPEEIFGARRGPGAQRPW